MSTLTHKVKMIGAKKPYTYFMIVFDPYQSVPEPSTPTPAKCESSKFIYFGYVLHLNV